MSRGHLTTVMTLLLMLLLKMKGLPTTLLLHCCCWPRLLRPCLLSRSTALQLLPWLPDVGEIAA